jgi:Carboxypeptidase regulatory-like domain
MELKAAAHSPRTLKSFRSIRWRNNVTRRSFCLQIFLFLLFAIAFHSAGWAQTGEILVNVTDSTGAVLVNVQLTVANTDTGIVRSAQTDSDGLAAIPSLQPGPYKVSATISGFKTEETTLTITVGQVASLNMTLVPASNTQSVEITAAPPLEVDTSTAAVAGMIPRTALNDLPVLNRGFIGLEQLLPGGAPSLPGDLRFGNQTTFGGSNVRSGYSVLIDGATMDHPIYGLSITDVNQDSVQEFRVLHNQYDAEYGRAGTAVVDVITRSGTNTWHGMFSYYGQTEALNAENYFAPPIRPAFSATHTSGTVGGPIIKNKAHFFFADEYIKSQNPDIIALPASNPFASTFNGVYPDSTSEKTIQAKVDYQLNDKNNFFVRYLWESQHILPTYQLIDLYNIAFNDGLLNWGHIFSPTKLNNAQLEYMDQNTLRSASATGPEIIRPSMTYGTPSNLPQAYPRRRIAVNDTFYWTKGRNTMKMGTRMAYEDLHQRGNFNGAGTWTFNTDTPFTPGVPATYPVAYSVGSGPTDVKYENAELSYFFNDDIKLTSRFTFNAGLRYDLETNLRDNPYVQNLLKNPEFPGLDTYVSGTRGNFKKVIQPRVGVAYNVRGNGHTVLRAGFGGYGARNRPFFDTQMESTDNNYTISITNPALLATYPSETAVLGGLTLQQYVALEGGRSLYLVGNDLNIPYVFEMTAGVEQTVLRNTVITVDGIRQDQIFLQTGRDYNLPAIGPLATHPRPLKQFGSATIFNGSTSSYYSALQIQVKSQYRWGSLQGAYTWGKVISDGLDDNSAATTDPFHVYGNNDRGLDEENLHSTLAISPIVNIPWGFMASGVIELTTGPPWNIEYGKDLDGDGNAQDRPAGLPKDSGGQHRVDYLNIINAARTATKSTTLPSGFVVPSLNSATCAATNTCLQPVTMGELTQSDGEKRFDLRLTKILTFKERYKLELFMEGYNIFNTPSFQAPNATISSPAFLTRSVADIPRQLQYGARFSF